MSIKKWLGIREPSEEIENAMVKAASVRLNPKKTEEEWIWIDGYKGTDSDMKCRDFQYELNKVYDIDNVEECHSGFHLCRDFDDVFCFYPFRDGNRFFKVKALVKKKDYEDYGRRIEESIFGYMYHKNKLVSKSIIFISELTTDEIFEMHCSQYKNWSSEDKELARLKGVSFVFDEIRVSELISLGYSRPFAEHLLHNDGQYIIAKAVGSQEDLSMDMKVAYIMRGGK